MKIKYNFFTVCILLLCISYILSFSNINISEISQYIKFSMLFLLVISYFLYSKESRTLQKKEILLFFVVSIYYGLLLIFSDFSSEDILNWIIVVICYLSNIIFVFSNLNLKEFRKIIDIIYNTLFVGLVIPSFILTFDPNYYYIQTERYRFISFMNNPNELAQFTCVVTLISFLKLCENHGYLKKIFYLIISIISIYIVLRTGSRASMIMLVSFFAFFIIGYFMKVYKIKKILAYLYSGIILLLILFLNAFFDKNTMLLVKLNYLSSNRLFIWKEVLDFNNIKTLLFGGKIIKSFGDVVITNAFIEIFGLLGIIGLILWLVILNSRISNSSNNRLISIFQFSVLCSYLIYYQFESGINGLANISSFFFWVVICFKNVKNSS